MLYWHGLLLFIVAFCVGAVFPFTKDDGCPHGWEEANWENSPGVKVGYWFCRKQ
jgi:hypothetical protein